MHIEVFGPGCANCTRLEQQTREALASLGEEAAVTKVEDMAAIAEAGVLRTPALRIDGKLILQGRVPGVTELKHILKNVGAVAS